MKTILVKSTGTSKTYGKLPKPEVEKFRRERINNSLENLRVMLLQSPAHQGLAGRRVEKAEILEHTVTFLKGQDDTKIRNGNVEQHFQDGYAACLKKAADFLRKHSRQITARSPGPQETQSSTAPAANLFSHLQKLTDTAAKRTTYNSTGHDSAAMPGHLSQAGQPGLMAAPHGQTFFSGQDAGSSIHKHSGPHVYTQTLCSGEDGNMHRHRGLQAHIKTLSILPKPTLSPRANSPSPASLSLSNSSCSRALWRPWP